jgi:PAS domain-containing protein
MQSGELGLRGETVSQDGTSLVNLLLGALPIGIVALRLETPDDDDSLRILYANEAARSALQVPELTESRVVDAFPRMPPARRKIYADVCRSGQGVDLGTVKFSDPRLVDTFFATRAQPLPDRSVAIMFEPMSAQRLAYAAALDASRFLDSIIEHVPAMVFLKEAKELRFVRFNRAGEELLGLPRSQLLGRNDHDFFPSEQAAFFVQKDREVLRTGRLEDIPEEPIATP